MKATLKKISTNTTLLRTDEVTGDLLHMPEIGMNIIMFSEPLNAIEGYTRMVKTSPVTGFSVLKKDLYSVTTRNSEYTLEILGNIVSE